MVYMSKDDDDGDDDNDEECIQHSLWTDIFIKLISILDDLLLEWNPKLQSTSFLSPVVIVPSNSNLWLLLLSVIYWP